MSMGTPLSNSIMVRQVPRFQIPDSSSPAMADMYLGKDHSKVAGLFLIPSFLFFPQGGFVPCNEGVPINETNKVLNRPSKRVNR